MESEILWTPNPKQVIALERPENEILYGGARGGGKVQPYSSKIMTPFSETTMGELRVGQMILTQSGSPTKVVAIHEQGLIDVYRVAFDDGAACEVGLEHNWLARTTASHKSKKRDDGSTWKVWTTGQMIEWLSGRQKGKSLTIPLCEPMKFTRPSRYWSAPPIHPYLLGVLIGDGSLTSTHVNDNKVRYTSADAEIAERLSALGYDYTFDANLTWTVMVDGVRDKLMTLGLYGMRSHEKFIPDYYKWLTVAQRYQLMQGLMDTDGYVDDRGHMSYTSTSKQLAVDVQWLARSLGAAATLTSRIPTCTNAAGGPKKCRRAYTVTIRSDDGRDMVGLTRKRERIPLCGFNGGLSERARRVVSIKKLKRRELGRCIQVDDPSSLYITDDFIVTHNTDAGIVWLLKWKDIPQCRALVLRLQANDLRDWADRAFRMFAPFGAIRRGRIPEFVFPSGYTIWTGHLQDDSSWANYQGFEIQKLLIEELTQIPNEGRYVSLLGSVRSTIDGIDRQVFSTCNPGGPGHQWVYKRFIETVDFKGRSAEPYKPTIMDRRGRMSRIFIPATVDDNPQLTEKDPGYVDFLDSLPDGQRQAWRFGDWNAFKGQYFSDFRKAPLPGEPNEACHVVPTRTLHPHCHRWMSWDWGYSHDSAVYWYARDEESRINVYRELVTRGLGAEEFGVKVAEMSLNDIIGLPNQCMTLHLSFDAFHKRDSSNTIAQQIEAGMSLVLGKDAIFLVDKDEREKAMSDEEAWLSVEKRRQAQTSNTRIVIERANNDRIGGWNYIRTLLRWKSLREKADAEVDLDLVRKILAMPDAAEKYADYLSGLRNRASEVLPRLVIHDCVKQLPDALLSAIYDERNPEDVKKQDGDDKIDSLRYGCIAHKELDLVLPRGEAIARSVEAKIAKYGSLSGTSIYLMQKMAEAKHDKKRGSEWANPGRSLGSRRMKAPRQ